MVEVRKKTDGRLSVILRIEIVEALDEAAKREGISRSDVIRRALIRDVMPVTKREA